jgi:hypothetical protein
MDDSPAPARHPGSGGTVEPMDRAAIAKARFQTPDLTEGPRFELRDVTTDLMYNAKTFDEMVVKADHVKALRFTAIDDQGRRTQLRKVDGLWQRPPWLEATKPVHARDEPASTPKVALPVAAAVAEPPAAVVARIDAEAERAALTARLEAALNDRYVIKRAMVTIGNRPVGQTEYRYRGDTSRVAFTESTFRLATDTNSPSVARSMVDVAEARNWQALRVSGHEDFRRMVWLEASVRGVKTIGYEPVAGDVELLRKEREARQVNRIEPTATASVPAPASAAKASARGSGNRKTVLAAIEAVLVAQRVPETRRDAIMAAAAENLAKRLAAGEVHKVKLYDKAAPQQRTVATPMPEPQRGRERTNHVR